MTGQEIINSLQTVFEACLKAGLVRTLQDAEGLIELLNEIKKKLHPEDA